MVPPRPRIEAAEAAARATREAGEIINDFYSQQSRPQQQKHDQQQQQQYHHHHRGGGGAGRGRGGRGPPPHHHQHHREHNSFNHQQDRNQHPQHQNQQQQHQHPNNNNSRAGPQHHQNHRGGFEGASPPPWGGGGGGRSGGSPPFRGRGGGGGEQQHEGGSGGGIGGGISGSGAFQHHANRKPHHHHSREQDHHQQVARNHGGSSGSSAAPTVSSYAALANKNDGQTSPGERLDNHHGDHHQSPSGAQQHNTGRIPSGPPPPQSRFTIFRPPSNNDDGGRGRGRGRDFQEQRDGSAGGRYHRPNSDHGGRGRGRDFHERDAAVSGRYHHHTGRGGPPGGGRGGGGGRSGLNSSGQPSNFRGGGGRTSDFGGEPRGGGSGGRNSGAGGRHHHFPPSSSWNNRGDEGRDGGGGGNEQRPAFPAGQHRDNTHYHQHNRPPPGRTGDEQSIRRGSVEGGGGGRGPGSGPGPGYNMSDTRRGEDRGNDASGNEWSSDRGGGGGGGRFFGRRTGGRGDRGGGSRGRGGPRATGGSGRMEDSGISDVSSAGGRWGMRGGGRQGGGYGRSFSFGRGREGRDGGRGGGRSERFFKDDYRSSGSRPVETSDQQTGATDPKYDRGDDAPKTTRYDPMPADDHNFPKRKRAETESNQNEEGENLPGEGKRIRETQSYGSEGEILPDRSSPSISGGTVPAGIPKEIGNSRGALDTSTRAAPFPNSERHGVYSNERPSHPDQRKPLIDSELRDVASHSDEGRSRGDGLVRDHQERGGKEENVSNQPCAPMESDRHDRHDSVAQDGHSHHDAANQKTSPEDRHSHDRPLSKTGPFGEKLHHEGRSHPDNDTMRPPFPSERRRPFEERYRLPPLESERRGPPEANSSHVGPSHQTKPADPEGGRYSSGGGWHSRHGELFSSDSSDRQPEQSDTSVSGPPQRRTSHGEWLSRDDEHRSRTDTQTARQQMSSTTEPAPSGFQRPGWGSSTRGRGGIDSGDKMMGRGLPPSPSARKMLFDSGEEGFAGRQPPLGQGFGGRGRGGVGRAGPGRGGFLGWGRDGGRGWGRGRGDFGRRDFERKPDRGATNWNDGESGRRDDNLGRSGGRGHTPSYESNWKQSHPSFLSRSTYPSSQGYSSRGPTKSNEPSHASPSPSPHRVEPVCTERDPTGAASEAAKQDPVLSGTDDAKPIVKQEEARPSSPPLAQPVSSEVIDSGPSAVTSQSAPPAPVTSEPVAVADSVLPPEPSETPSGYVLALTRLADLEAQLEHAFAKQKQLMVEQTKLRAQYEVLESLPVGIDAIKDELELLTMKTAPG